MQSISELIQTKNKRTLIGSKRSLEKEKIQANYLKDPEFQKFQKEAEKKWENKSFKEKLILEHEDFIIFLRKLDRPRPAPPEIEGDDWKKRHCVQYYREKLLEAWNHNNTIWNEMYDWQVRILPFMAKNHPDKGLSQELSTKFHRFKGMYYKYCVAQRQKLDQIYQRAEYPGSKRSAR